MVGRQPSVSKEIQIELYKKYEIDLLNAKNSSDPIYLVLSNELKMTSRAVFLSVQKLSFQIFGKDFKKEKNYVDHEESDVDSDYEDFEFEQFDKKYVVPLDNDELSPTISEKRKRRIYVPPCNWTETLAILLWNICKETVGIFKFFNFLCLKQFYNNYRFYAVLTINAVVTKKIHFMLKEIAWNVALLYFLLQ